LTRGLCPLDPLRGFAPHPTRGLRPLDSACGALPHTPPKGFALWKPSRGAAPAPRKGHCPLTHHPEILKDFRGVLFWRSLIYSACLIWGNQGAFRSPPGPLRFAPLLTVLSKQQRKNHSSSKQVNTPSSVGGPKVSKGRSESPLAGCGAEPHKDQLGKENPFL